MIKLSVIIPAFNPDPSRFSQTLSALQEQTLDKSDWELIIVDNNSSPELEIHPGWHPAQKVVRESKPGLTHARLKGFGVAAGEILVMVDDDNVLMTDYLQNILDIFRDNHTLGAAGGKSIPLFEAPPPNWLRQFYGSLALRDLGNDILLESWAHTYPVAAPIGAGMGIRKAALPAYINKAKNRKSIIADRTGSQLTSGGDNDIVIEILKAGWQVGYFPSLALRHLIPEGRMQVAYLSRLVNHTNRSWVQVIEQHQINPWKKIPAWTVPLRKARAWFSYRAWKGGVNYINWKGACGQFDGLASI